MSDEWTMPKWLPDICDALGLDVHELSDAEYETFIDLRTAGLLLTEGEKDAIDRESAQHRRDALDGQATMDEAYNTITHLKAENAALLDEVGEILKDVRRGKYILSTEMVQALTRLYDKHGGGK